MRLRKSGVGSGTLLPGREIEPYSTLANRWLILNVSDTSERSQRTNWTSNDSKNIVINSISLAPFAVFQDERAVYHEDINDCSGNERAMDGTALAISLFAVF